MKNGRPQAKDVPEGPILLVLSKSQRLMTHWDYPDPGWSIVVAAPELRRFPEKVLRAKLSAMKRKGLVDGCDCSCRGDWVITREGAALIGHSEPLPGQYWLQEPVERDPLPPVVDLSDYIDGAAASFGVARRMGNARPYTGLGRPTRWDGETPVVLTGAECIWLALSEVARVLAVGFGLFRFFEALHRGKAAS